MRDDLGRKKWTNKLPEAIGTNMLPQWQVISLSYTTLCYYFQRPSSYRGGPYGTIFATFCCRHRQKCSVSCNSFKRLSRDSSFSVDLNEIDCGYFSFGSRADSSFKSPFLRAAKSSNARLQLRRAIKIQVEEKAYARNTPSRR